MKKFVFALLLMVASIGASAENSIRFFTLSQVNRTVSYLNAQNELMIYCGYADELETYVILSEVWAEQINSKYYEVWIYGFDAYTGDEICMPIDLSCIWLYSGSRYYSAASYLRFHSSVVLPSNFGWYMPEYNAFARRPHPAGMMRSYHYDIHLYGWAPPSLGHNPNGLPPYYCRHYYDPAPVPMHAWTPGREKPVVVSNGHSYLGGTRTGSSSSAGLVVNTRGGNTNVSPVSESGRNAGSSNANSSSSSGRGSSASSSSSSSGRGSSSSSSSSSSGRGSSSSSSSSSSGRGSSASSSSSSSGRGSASSSGTVNRASSPNVYPSSSTGRGSSSSSANSSSSNGRGSSSSSASSSTGRGSSTSSSSTSGRSSTSSSSTSGRSSSTSSSSTSGRSSSASSNGRGSSSSNGR